MEEMMASRPTGKKRNTRQKTKAKYSKAREDAQLQGVIDTTPEGAVREERVDPATQDSQRLDSLVIKAAAGGWATKPEAKARVVAELFGIVTAGEGVEAKTKVSAARALGALDQLQHERDKEASGQPGQPRVGADGKIEVNVNVSNNQQVAVAVDPFEAYRKLMTESDSDTYQHPIQSAPDDLRPALGAGPGEGVGRMGEGAGGS